MPVEIILMIIWFVFLVSFLVFAAKDLKKEAELTEERARVLREYVDTLAKNLQDTLESEHMRAALEPVKGEGEDDTDQVSP